MVRGQGGARQHKSEYRIQPMIQYIQSNLLAISFHFKRSSQSAMYASKYGIFIYLFIQQKRITVEEFRLRLDL